VYKLLREFIRREISSGDFARSLAFERLPRPTPQELGDEEPSELEFTVDPSDELDIHVVSDPYVRHNR